ERLSALAIRWRCRLAAAPAQGHNTQDTGRQSSRSLCPVARSPNDRRRPGKAQGGLMNIAIRQPAAAQRLKLIDCDIHPVYRTPAELPPFMSARWREHMATFGTHFRHGLTGQLPYPRMTAAGMRVDAFPENGGPPGCDLDLMRKQHLDANGVECGMLIALSRGGMEERNLDFGAALSSAINDWQLECWVKKEPRL